MVGLHVVCHQIVWLAIAQRSLQVSLPLLALAAVGGIQDGNLVIVDEIGVITHALGHYILALEQINVEVVDTDILDGITNHIHIRYIIVFAKVAIFFRITLPFGS